MNKHLWKLVSIALVIAVVAGCSSKQITSQQASSRTQAQTANAASRVRPTPDAASDSQRSKPAQSSVSAGKVSATGSRPAAASGSAKQRAVSAKPAAAKTKPASVVAPRRSAAAKPVSSKADIRKADARKAVKPQAVASAPRQLPRLLDLGATKCIPCKMMVPVLEDLTKEYKGKLKVEFIDVWENPSAARSYGIESIPTQIFFDANGKEVYRHVGFFPKEEIVAKLSEMGIK